MIAAVRNDPVPVPELLGWSVDAIGPLLSWIGEPTPGNTGFAIALRRGLWRSRRNSLAHLHDDGEIA